MKARNAQYNEFGGIDCEIEHPAHGWIPFTASPDDPEKHGRDIFHALKDKAAPYEAPPPPDPAEALAAEREAMVVPMADFLVILAEADWITEEEYKAWLSRNALPADVEAMIDQMPNKGDRIRALRYALGATQFERLHTMVEQIAEIKRKQTGMTEEETAMAVDDLFRAAKQTGL